MSVWDCKKQPDYLVDMFWWNKCTIKECVSNIVKDILFWCGGSDVYGYKLYIPSMIVCMFIVFIMIANKRVSNGVIIVKIAEE